MTSAEHKPHSMQDDLRKLIADWEDLSPVEQERYAVGYADQAIGMLEGLFEQLEAVEKMVNHVFNVSGGGRWGPHGGWSECPICVPALAVFGIEAKAEAYDSNPAMNPGSPATVGEEAPGLTATGTGDVDTSVEKQRHSGASVSSPASVPDDRWNADCWKGYEDCDCRRRAAFPAKRST